MKNLVLFVSLLIAGASYTPPVNNAGEPGSSGNAYVYIDSNTVVKNYIRFFGHPENSLPVSEELFVLDEQFGEYRQMMAEKYVGYQSIFNFEQKRSILGFDAPSLKSIDRVTVSIKFKIYKNWDLGGWFPQIAQEDFVIKSSNRYQPYGYYALHGLNGVSGSDTKLDHMSNYSIPYIGTVSDILALEDNLDAAVANDDSIFNITRSVNNFEYVIDNPALGDNYYSILSSNLATKQFYVVMPCYYDISQVWISVAGIDINDDPVLDGLDSSGVPFTTDIGGQTYKYIDLNSTSVRSVYFSEVSTIRSIVVSGVDVGGHEVEPYIRFGDYDFTENDFNVLLNEFHLTDTGEYINSLQPAFTVLSGYDAVVSAVLLGDFNIRIFYTSEGIAVYQNIVGIDGIENPISEPVAPGDSSSWWDDYFFNPLTDALATLGLVFRIVLLVVGLGVITTVIIFIVQNLNKSKKGGHKK